mgnify:FL=1
MKKYFTLLIVLCSLNVFSQSISVDNSTSQQQLVDMLLNNACLEVSNISISSNVSVASFDNNNGDFPISEGVIIRSGEAQYTAGM